VTAASPVLSVRELSVEYPREPTAVRAVDGISFEVARGETVGLVGESGCGKSTAALALFRLVPPPGRITAGRVLVDGTDILPLSEPEIRKFRGAGLAYVPQETGDALNPVLSIGAQIVDVVRAHHDVSRREAWNRAIEGLRQVGIADPERRAKEYAHQYSGGMKQRALLAMALAAGPKVLVADEPTTAVDVTMQAGIIDLLRRLAEERELGVLLVSHDLGVIASLCDRVLVMYAGRIVEQAPVDTLFRAPLHPYTKGLIACLPGPEVERGRLPAIPGGVPDLAKLPRGCAFHPRCAQVEAACREVIPALAEASAGHSHACTVMQRKGTQ
jgi:peptide/nickel transport system ATP-binding protein/oligopeptide transport system ATP-binding protein